MSRLFIELYFDEDIDVAIAGALRKQGFDVVTTRDAGRLESLDVQQLEYATGLGRAIVTHNRTHFEVLARQAVQENREHRGIIIATRRERSELVRRLVELLNEVTADEMTYQVRYV